MFRGETPRAVARNTIYSSETWCLRCPKIECTSQHPLIKTDVANRWTHHIDEFCSCHDGSKYLYQRIGYPPPSAFHALFGLHHTSRSMGQTRSLPGLLQSLEFSRRVPPLAPRARRNFRQLVSSLHRCMPLLLDPRKISFNRSTRPLATVPTGTTASPPTVSCTITIFSSGRSRRSSRGNR